jgi:polyphosphate kinase
MDEFGCDRKSPYSLDLDMPTETILRLEVASADLLIQLLREPLPFGMRAGGPSRSFLRDLYLDTPDGELQRRGIGCRFRITVDDRRILTVTIREAVDPTELVEWQRFESEVPEIDPADALQGTSEPARRLRAVLDPRRCGIRVELETERYTRIARQRTLPLKVFDIAYDQVAVRSGTLVRGFQEIRIQRLKRGGPHLNEIARVFQQTKGVRPVNAGKLERAEELLNAMEGEAPLGAVTTVPEVVLLATQCGHVAMIAAEGVLRLPVLEGKGKKTCEKLLRQCLGTMGSDLQLLDTLGATPVSPAMEVWLGKEAQGNPVQMNQAGCEWVRWEDVCGLVGTPVLRDKRTLAALSLISRSDAAEWPAVPVDESVAVIAGPRYSSSGALKPVLSAEQLDARKRIPEQLLNGEISCLQFNQRLIELAEDQTVPLLARIRFLAIFSSNIDEFFMVQVGSLKRSLAEGDTGPGFDGMGVHDLFDAVAVRLRYLSDRLRRCFEQSCLPHLREQGIRILRWSQTSSEDRAYLRTYYEEQIFPLLTPHAITRAPGHPFPHIANLELSIALMVRDADSGRLRFGTLTLPAGVPRFIQVRERLDFVPLEEVIGENLSGIYPGRLVEAAHCFRVTRVGDLELDEERADDLLEAVEEEVKRRPFAGVVRLELERSMPRELRDLLQRELRLVSSGRAGAPGAAGIFEVDGMMDLTGLMEIAAIKRPDLDYPSFEGVSPIDRDRDIFEAIRERDILVHQPYDSFEHSTQRLLETAADDPDVESIRLTLYRAGGRSPVVNALIRAARVGKRVAVFVELKARFDEERNVEWVRQLEAAGVHVVYGLVRLKTHAKTALIVRREGNAIRRYAHIGTGNYNAATARLYTDLGLLSAEPDLGADLNDLFNELTGASSAPQTTFRKLLVAPNAMLDRFQWLIQREIEHAKIGRPARIRAKLNGLAYARIVSDLYRASQAGVDVDLIVRGICTLRPGVPGLSDRVRVVTHVGRFLEHARIYNFANGGQEEYYIGSADWRPRNLRRRVEVVAPVTDRDACTRLDRILETELANERAWELGADGRYTRRTVQSEALGHSAQEQFIAWTRDGSKRS